MSGTHREERGKAAPRAVRAPLLRAPRPGGAEGSERERRRMAAYGRARGRSR